MSPRLPRALRPKRSPEPWPFPAGGEAPLVFNLRFSLAGYQVGVRGQAAIARARELAHAAGIPQSQSLAALAGDPLILDLVAAGPWIPQEEIPLRRQQRAEPWLPRRNCRQETALRLRLRRLPRASSAAVNSGADSLTGTVTVRNANWKADYLASHVEIAEATLHLDGTSLRWEPVVFAYGPVKGTATLNLPIALSRPTCRSRSLAPQNFKCNSPISTRARSSQHCWARRKKLHCSRFHRSPASLRIPALACP